ncbi:MAG: hypothetical protein ACI9LV_000372 [Candidatus Nanohaloarchaea archaeon]|jgi:hypothetical protein
MIQKLSDRIKNSKAYVIFPWKLSAIFLAVGLLAVGYSHSPPGVYVNIFYISFASLGGIGLWIQRSIDTEKARYYFLALSSFFLTVAGLRAFVGFAGIGTPRSVGQIGPFVIEQLWIGGVHLHHYFLAPLFLAWAYFGFGDQYRKKAILYGIGAGLLMDEMGIILAGPPYYNIYSYPAIIITQILLLAVILREKHK